MTHPNRSRLSTNDRLRIRLDYQDGWYVDHPGQPNYNALISRSPGTTLREAISPLCSELGVSAADIKTDVTTRAWGNSPESMRNITYVTLRIGGAERGVIMQLAFDTETILDSLLGNLLD